MERRRRDDRGRHDDLDLGLRRGRGRRAAAAAGVVIRAVVRAVRESDRDRIRRDVAVVQDLVLEGREGKRNDTLGFLKESKFSLSLFSLSWLCDMVMLSVCVCPVLLVVRS